MAATIKHTMVGKNILRRANIRLRRDKNILNIIDIGTYLFVKVPPTSLTTQR